MKATVITSYDDPEPLQLQEVGDPEPKDDEVLIKVEAAGINRADTLQKRGQFHPPRGPIPIPGVEASGIVLAVGKDVSRWKVGDQVLSINYCNC